MNTRLIAASAIVALAVAHAAAAQGNSGGLKSQTPNGNRLVTRGAGSSTLPVALVDDASLIDPGSASVSFSVMRWQGAGIGEVDAPIVTGAVGLSTRVQFTASVPHVVGSGDLTGATGGAGTVFLGGKIGLFTNASLGMKVAVSPTAEVLSRDALASMPAGSRRTQFGLPIGVELQRGPGKIFAAMGYFSTGSWFTGIGAGLQVTPKTVVSLSFSRAWMGGATTAPSAPGRNEASVGVSRAVASLVSVYGSLAQTVATLDQNGAGTTVAAGLSLSLPAGTFTR